MRFLIDECLSLDLVGEAHRAGFEAYHVGHIGKAGWKDWNVAAFALAQDMVVVTNNATDFRALFRREPLHSGLVVIVPSVDRATEAQLFREALVRLIDVNDLVNKVLEVDFVSGGANVRIYDLPASPE